ncbi:MAG TPA: hypothetical protein VD862_04195 [Candidatus Paceibacterota bacterium]|nr:hypothetical protein [Candidatus Paceibacterota bacterium]
MAKALVIVLHERRFFHEAKLFVRYLRDSARVPVSVRTVRDGRSAVTRGHITEFLTGDDGTVRLLAYFGHGEAGRWVTTPGETVLRFSDLSDLLESAGGPTLIVNDSCFADTLGFTLDVRNADASRHGVINASGFSEIAWLDILSELLCSRWDRGLPMIQGTAFNWGSEYTLWHPEEVRTFWSPLRDALSYAQTWLRSAAAGWRREKVLQQTITRWGAVLDHHFYPKE